jgi:hypothetical protein
MFAGSGTAIELEDIAVESDYKGPHVKLPMTIQNLQELIDGFKSKKVKLSLFSSFFSFESSISSKFY